MNNCAKFLLSYSRKQCSKIHNFTRIEKRTPMPLSTCAVSDKISNTIINRDEDFYVTYLNREMKNTLMNYLHEMESVHTDMNKQKFMLMISKRNSENQARNDQAKEKTFSKDICSFLRTVDPVFKNQIKLLNDVKVLLHAIKINSNTVHDKIRQVEQQIASIILLSKICHRLLKTADEIHLKNSNDNLLQFQNNLANSPSGVWFQLNRRRHLDSYYEPVSKIIKVDKKISAHSNPNTNKAVVTVNLVNHCLTKSRISINENSPIFKVSLISQLMKADLLNFRYNIKVLDKKNVIDLMNNEMSDKLCTGNLSKEDVQHIILDIVKNRINLNKRFNDNLKMLVKVEKALRRVSHEDILRNFRVCIAHYFLTEKLKMLKFNLLNDCMYICQNKKYLRIFEKAAINEAINVEQRESFVQNCKKQIQDAYRTPKALTTTKSPTSIKKSIQNIFINGSTLQSSSHKIFGDCGLRINSNIDSSSILQRSLSDVTCTSLSTTPLTKIISNNSELMVVSNKDVRLHPKPPHEYVSTLSIQIKSFSSSGYLAESPKDSHKESYNTLLNVQREISTKNETLDGLLGLKEKSPLTEPSPKPEDETKSTKIGLVKNHFQQEIEKLKDVKNQYKTVAPTKVEEAVPPTKTKEDKKEPAQLIATPPVKETAVVDVKYLEKSCQKSETTVIEKPNQEVKEEEQVDENKSSKEIILLHKPDNLVPVHTSSCDDILKSKTSIPAFTKSKTTLDNMTTKTTTMEILEKIKNSRMVNIRHPHEWRKTQEIVYKAPDANILIKKREPIEAVDSLSPPAPVPKPKIDYKLNFKPLARMQPKRQIVYPKVEVKPAEKDNKNTPSIKMEPILPKKLVIPQSAQTPPQASQNKSEKNELNAESESAKKLFTNTPQQTEQSKINKVNLPTSNAASANHAEEQKREMNSVKASESNATTTSHKSVDTSTLKNKKFKTKIEPVLRPNYYRKFPVKKTSKERYHKKVDSLDKLSSKNSPLYTQRKPAPQTTISNKTPARLSKATVNLTNNLLHKLPNKMWNHDLPGEMQKKGMFKKVEKEIEMKQKIVRKKVAKGPYFVEE